MSSVTRYLSRNRPTTFSLYYSPEYRSFINHRILDDPNHPLYLQRKRIEGQRKNEGLRWHATASSSACKSSVVRSWARRRLRNAFVKALSSKGFDENGRLVHVQAAAAAAAWAKPSGVLQQARPPCLTGSVRLHAEAPLVSAKFAQVEAEMARIVDALLTTLGPAQRAAGRPEKKVGQWNSKYTGTRAGKPSHPPQRGGNATKGGRSQGATAA